MQAIQHRPFLLLSVLGIASVRFSLSDPFQFPGLEPPKLSEQVLQAKYAFIDNPGDPAVKLVEDADIHALFRQLKHEPNKTIKAKFVRETMDLDSGQVAVVQYIPDANPVLDREYYCNNNSLLVGNQCVRTVPQKAHKQCPVGMKRQGDRCITIVPTQLLCPDGYTLEHKKCVSSSVVPPTYACTGTLDVLDAEARTCTRTFHEAQQCPDGYDLNADGQCISAVPASLSCPDGYTISFPQNSCLRDVAVDPVVLCPANSNFDQNAQVCVMEYQGPAQCPPQYTYNPTDNNCIALAQKAPDACPDGYTMTDDNYCERNVVVAATPSCANGYTLVNGVCQGGLQSAFACPDGYTENDGQCERIVESVATCPEGTTPIATMDISSGLSRTQCQNDSVADLIKCCDKDFELVNNTHCSRQVSSAPTWSCEGDCYTFSSSSPLYACPNGTLFVGEANPRLNLTEPSCIRNISLEVCIVGEVENATTPCSNGPAVTRLRRMQDAEEDDADGCIVLPRCHNLSRIEVYSAVPVCPDGGEVIDGYCVTRTPLPAEPSCADGDYDEETGTCISEEFQTTRDRCLLGGTSNGVTCVVTTYVEPNYECPDDTEEDDNGNCVQTVAGVLSSRPPLTAAPTSGCNANEYLNEDGATCTQVIQRNLSYSCLEGTTETSDGLCIFEASLIAPSPVQTTYAPQYMCPDGSATTLARRCHSIERAPITATCPQGYTMNDRQDMCTRVSALLEAGSRTVTFAAQPTCPPYHRLNRSNCVASFTAEPEIVCPEPATWEDDRCIYTAPLSTVCPKASTFVNDSCVKQVMTPARQRVVTGCVSGGDALEEGQQLQCF